MKVLRFIKTSYVPRWEDTVDEVEYAQHLFTMFVRCCPNIHTIQFDCFYCQHEHIVFPTVAITNWTKLNTIILTSTTTIDDNVCLIIDHCAATLTHLNISNNLINNNACLQEIANKCTELRVFRGDGLEFGTHNHNNSSTSAFGFDALTQRCHKLTHFAAKDACFTTTGVCNMFINWKQIQIINLFYADFRDNDENDHIMPVPSTTDTTMSCLELHTLILSQCYALKAPDVRFITQFTPNLTELDLSWCCNVDDDCLADISQHCKQLQKLNLTCCSGLRNQATAHLIACKNLQELNVIATSVDSLAEITTILNECGDLKQLQWHSVRVKNI